MDPVTFQVDEFIVTVHFKLNSTQNLIQEGKQRGQILVGQYSYRMDSPHVPPGQKHIHILKKGSEILSLNIDGSAHDASHKQRIPNKVAKAIKDKFPEIELPPENIIESNQLNDFGNQVPGTKNRIIKE